MSGTGKVIKGRIKEATGSLTGNDRLRSRGQADQAVGHAQQKAEDTFQKVKDSARTSVDRAEEKARRAIAKAEDKA